MEDLELSPTAMSPVVDILQNAAADHGQNIIVDDDVVDIETDTCTNHLGAGAIAPEIAESATACDHDTELQISLEQDGQCFAIKRCATSATFVVFLHDYILNECNRNQA